MKNILSVTSYLLVLYSEKYLHIYQFKLRDKKIDMQAKLEQFIPYRSIIYANSSIKRHMRICLRIAKK